MKQGLSQIHILLLADIQSSVVLLGLNQELHALFMLTVLQEEVSCGAQSHSHFKSHTHAMIAGLDLAIMCLAMVVRRVRQSQYHSACTSWNTAHPVMADIPQRAMTAGSDLAVRLLAMVAKVSNKRTEKANSPLNEAVYKAQDSGDSPQRAMTTGSDLAVRLLAMAAKVSNKRAEKQSSRARRSLPAFWNSSTALSSSRRCSKYSAVSSITNAELCTQR